MRETIDIRKKEKRALTGEEARRILGASEAGKTLFNANVVLIFENGKLVVSNVYKLQKRGR